jgi:hypothetical protein
MDPTIEPSMHGGALKPVWLVQAEMLKAGPTYA